jgi:hypothetical protein
MAVRAALVLAIAPALGLVDDAEAAWAQYAAGRASVLDPYHNAWYTMGTATPLPTLANIKLAGSAGARFASRLPPGTVAAMSEHGYIGAIAPDLVIIDLVGLHDRRIARSGFSAADLMQRRPDVIWGPHPDYRWIVEDIVRDAAFWREYDYYPSALNFGVALRRSSDRFGDISRIFAEEWALVYPGFSMSSYRATRRASSSR